MNSSGWKMITGKNYIGNTTVASGSRTFKTFNPKENQENDWTFVEASESELNQAVLMAQEAFRTYRNTSGAERSAFLNAIADEMMALGDVLLEVYCTESGLPKDRAVAERTRTVFQLHSFAELLTSEDWKEISIDTAIPDRTPTPKPDLRRSVLPLGPVAVFGSSNFPLAYSTAGGDTASALAAGCPVVVKSHPMHAGTGELVASAIIKAAQRTGMPDGVFSNLNSSGIEVGEQLVSHPGIKAVGFTGSIRGGRALFDLAARRPEPIPVFAEMGSINPVVISGNALNTRAKHWAGAYVKSITLGAGQFCTNPGLILAMDVPGLKTFAEHLAQEIVKEDPVCMLHPKIKASFSGLKKEAVAQEGVEVLTPALEVDANYADQTVVMVDGEHFLRNSNLHKEVFGPFSMIVKCKDEAQLLRIIEGLEGQLTGTIIAEEEDFGTLFPVIDALRNRVGRVIFNGVPTGVEVCPSMHHGGPYPATTDSRFTAVGTHSIRRWVRLVAYQNFPQELLPPELQK